MAGAPEVAAISVAGQQHGMVVLDAVQRHLESRGERGRLRVLLHSLAFGTLRPFVADPIKEADRFFTENVGIHKILVVDDEAAIRDLIAESLKSWENRIVLDVISVEPSPSDGSDVLITISYRAVFDAAPQNLAVALPLGSF